MKHAFENIEVKRDAGIHPYAELSKNGLLKRGYSVECVGRYLDLPYETHVAIEDALMETEIAVRLGLFDCAAVCWWIW